MTPGLSCPCWREVRWRVGVREQVWRPVQSHLGRRTALAWGWDHKEGGMAETGPPPTLLAPAEGGAGRCSLPPGAAAGVRGEGQNWASDREPLQMVAEESELRFKANVKFKTSEPVGFRTAENSSSAVANGDPPTTGGP